MIRTLIFTAALGMSTAAGAVDVNCLFPTNDTEKPCPNADAVAKAPAAPKAPYHYEIIAELPDGTVIEHARQQPGKAPTKNIVSASCDFDSRSNVVTFGACAEKGESVLDRDGRTYRVRRPVNSHSYPLGAVNNKAEPTIDDWNGAFAGGGSN